MERRKKRAQRKGIDESYPTLELVVQKKKSENMLMTVT